MERTTCCALLVLLFNSHSYLPSCCASLVCHARCTSIHWSCSATLLYCRCMRRSSNTNTEFLCIFSIGSCLHSFLCFFSFLLFSFLYVFTSIVHFSYCNHLFKRISALLVCSGRLTCVDLLSVSSHT